MDTHTLQPAFRASGPVATTLIDVSHDDATGAHQHELRVRSACEELKQAGAPESVVEAVNERLSVVVRRPAPVAHLVVADSGEVLIDEVATLPVDRPVTTWGPLPDLARWIRHRDLAVTFVLALVDHAGGRVEVYDSGIAEALETDELDGEDLYLQKVQAGDWAEPQYQHGTEDTWARNADLVADQVLEHVRAGHRLVLLSGDPQSRPHVLERLAKADATVIELGSYSRARDGGEDALWAAVRDALRGHMMERRLALRHELIDRLGQNRAVATGVDDIADALVRGQVETLLIDPEQAAELTLDVTKHEGLDLPAERLPADLGLVAAAVRTDAEVSVLPADAMAGAPVAALLRW